MSRWDEECEGHTVWAAPASARQTFWRGCYGDAALRAEFLHHVHAGEGLC